MTNHEIGHTFHLGFTSVQTLKKCLIAGKTPADTMMSLLGTPDVGHSRACPPDQVKWMTMKMLYDSIRVAKCQFFYTDNFCPTKFSPRKSA